MPPGKSLYVCLYTLLFIIFMLSHSSLIFCFGLSVACKGKASVTHFPREMLSQDTFPKGLQLWFIHSFDCFGFTSFLPLLNANEIHAIEKCILEVTKGQKSWLFTLLTMIILSVPHHSPAWNSPSTIAFCSQSSCITKWNLCHTSFAVWQNSGKRMMLSSLTICLVLCLSLYYQECLKT